MPFALLERRGRCAPAGAAGRRFVMAAKETLRLAAVGDLHCAKTSQGALQSLLAQIAEHADVLLLCGDLTDYGLREEAQLLARELSVAVKIPVVAVLGNHDFHSDKQDEVKKILA